jgi:hypothetical protein
VLTNSFKYITPGISPFFSADYDILHLLKQLLATIPITIVGEWVKGHYTGKRKKIQHRLNETADAVAGAHLEAQGYTSPTNQPPVPYPGYRVRLLKDNHVLTSKYYQAISQACNEKPLQDYILKNTKWSSREFYMLHWDAHEKASLRLTRHQQITMTKLIHNLANTNKQNFLYYQMSPLCLGCLSVEGAFEHVLWCTLPHTAAYRTQQISDLQQKMRNINTPSPVIKAILQGFCDWITPPANCSRAPTYGSLNGPDIFVTSAYFEQFHQVSWFQLCLGRISKTWSKVVSAYQASVHSTFNEENWAVNFISLVWNFTRNMWNNRNQIVHGKTVEETVSNQMVILHNKVRSLCQ